MVNKSINKKACENYLFEDYHLKCAIAILILGLMISVNYHQFIFALNNVFSVNIANITLISLWAVASTAFL